MFHLKPLLTRDTGLVVPSLQSSQLLSELSAECCQTHELLGDSEACALPRPLGISVYGHRLLAGAV